MNIRLLLFSTLLVLQGVLATLHAQNWVSDSTTMGPSYANDVFYSIENGFIKQEPANNWDLAFRIGSRNDAIRINSYNTSAPTQLRTGRLFIYPKAGIDGWTSFDTSGWNTWLELFNNETNWELGAFNVSATGFPDFSWGVYDFNTKIVAGDSLYLLVVNDGGTFRHYKIWIINKDFGTWNVRFANADGTGDQTIQIRSSDYASKNFVYLNLGGGATAYRIIDREPASNSWDLLFTRYAALQPSQNVYYPVMGVLTNIPIKTAKAEDTPSETAKWDDYKASLDTAMNVIGADWKFFNNVTFQWEFFDDSLSYFVQLANGAAYQMKFTGFSGATTGKSIFAMRKVGAGTFVNKIEKGSVSLYPNPVKNQIFFATLRNTEILSAEIYNTNGTAVKSTDVWNNTLDVSALPSGMYLIKTYDSVGNTAVTRFIK